MRVLKHVLVVVILLATPLQLSALQSSNSCSECVLDSTQGGASSCDPEGYQNWAGCQARYYCEVNGDGRRQCWYDCTGFRCLWV